MGQRGFCGCCSLKSGAFFTALLAIIYNGALIYWFAVTMQGLSKGDDLFLVVIILVEVLMFLASVHIAVTAILVYGVAKNKPDLVMLWIVIYISSCQVVSSLFTLGLAFMFKRIFLLIIFFNFLSTLNVVMMIRLYKEMVESNKKDAV